MSDTSIIPTIVSSSVIKKELVLASRMEIEIDCDSNHYIFQLYFCTHRTVNPAFKKWARVGIKSLEPTSWNVNEHELNVKGLKKMFGQEIPKSWNILDSQSTVNCFCNQKYLSNIQQVNATVVIRCDVGVHTINWMRDFKWYLELVWLDVGGIANFISLKRAKK